MTSPDDRPDLPPEKLAVKGLNCEHELLHELEQLFNRISLDNELNTPDYMLAEYVVTHLTDLKLLIDCRRSWGCK